MTLIGAILKKVQSKEVCLERTNKYGGNTSPPPELDETSIERRIGRNKKKRVDKFAHVVPRVDSSPPKLYPRLMFQKLPTYKRNFSTMFAENLKLVAAIKAHHFSRGRVDCNWKHPPKRSLVRYWQRERTLRDIETTNMGIYHMIKTAKPRVATTHSLRSDWARNRQEIIHRAEKPFVLFPFQIRELLEDPVFLAPEGFKRPRVYITLRVNRGACLGSLCVELFTDACPATCQLFMDLLDGDGLGHGYVTTRFFRKVPRLYWSGGDVIYDNGFGCYAQRGRRVPIGAENHHYPHSIPGLLSMRLTPNDEMCGVFNITFKPLPQFDLKNVVFGRVIRPSSTYDTVQSIGTALGSQPVVQIEATRRFHAGRWIHGAPNTRLLKHPNRLKAYGNEQTV